MLANSLDTFAPPRGVLWQPDRREVYTAVAFVFNKHIELNGRYLLVRTDPPPTATLKQPPTVDESQFSPDSVVPGSRACMPPYEGEYAGYGADEFYEDEDEVASPDLPAAVRNSFVSGARAMHGLRYSVELSPVIEGHEPAIRSRAAAGKAAAGGAGRRGLPTGGKFGVPLAGQGEALWEGEDWASEEMPAEASTLDDSAIWEGGWQAPVEDFSIFDETIHPLRPGDAGHESSSLQSVSNFIRALAQTARMGAEASVVALAYIERLISGGGFPLNSRTWKRCALVAWLLASKMWDDECYENPQFAQLFGYDVDDLNALEQRFVSALGFRLGVSSAEYARYYFALRSICQTSTEDFPLRPLDAELESKLAKTAASINGCALGSWAAALENADLSRSA